MEEGSAFVDGVCLRVSGGGEEDEAREEVGSWNETRKGVRACAK